MKQETTKEKIIRKLTSRKLWAAVCAFVVLIAVAMGKTEAQAAQISALIMAGATVIAYIVGEGLTDAAAVGAAKDNDEKDEKDEKPYSGTSAYGFAMPEPEDVGEEIARF